MAKRRTTNPTDASADGEVLARLRLHDRTATDWASSAEGFLILYDPSVVTDDVFDALYGLQTVLRPALGWMNGDAGGGPTFGDLIHQQAHGRSEDAARVARATQLGWECSLAVLPLVVASNGANVRFRATPPTADEKKAMAAFQREKRRGSGPSRAWIITRGPRLGVTWDFFLGFTSEQRRETFGPGGQVEVEWPAGAYRVNGWTFPELEGHEDGWLDQYLIELCPWV